MKNTTEIYPIYPAVGHQDVPPQAQRRMWLTGKLNRKVTAILP
jgi:hypothetical protein